MGKNKEKKIKIITKTEKMPETKEEMVEAFLREQEAIQNEYCNLDIASEILNNKQLQYEGKIAKQRLGLLNREKQVKRRERRNIEYGRAINKIYPNSIVFDNGVNSNGDTGEDGYEEEI